MDFGLQGKVALVTGGSRGIGRATVHDFAREGCRVAFSARGVETLRATEQEVKDLGAEALGVPADMTNTADIEHVVEQTVERFGTVDILVNNVGGSRGGQTWDTTDEDWAEVLYLNLFAAVRTSRLVIPLMRKKNWGRIINITSIYGREAGGAMTYNAVKASMNSWSKSLSKQLAKDSIMVNVVAPGSVLFPGGAWERRQQENPVFIENFVRNDMPMGRFGKPEEVAAMVVFLASERASLMSGACINVDGCQSRSNI
jgi:3-oxoacyl-[acyl-carrier protein] reductase